MLGGHARLVCIPISHRLCLTRLSIGVVAAVLPVVDLSQCGFESVWSVELVSLVVSLVSNGVWLGTWNGKVWESLDEGTCTAAHIAVPGSVRWQQP